MLFVDAPIVWEAARWGVRRPVWGKLIERYSEARFFTSADVVACVSESVAASGRRARRGPGSGGGDALRCGPRRVLSVPESRRDPSPARHTRATRFWSLGPEAFGDSTVSTNWSPPQAEVLPGTRATMLFVGDGAERSAVEAGLAAAGVSAIFTGNRPHHEIPDLLGASDIGVVTAQDRETFHYSPIKLSEYLAAGLAVVVPDAGGLGSRVESGIHGIVYPTDSVSALAEAIGSPRARRGFARLDSAPPRSGSRIAS